MKRIIAFVLTFVMCLMFAGCSPKNPHEGEASFTGVVMRDMNGCIIVETEDIYEGKTEAVLVEVSKDTRDKTEQDEYLKGTKVKVYYDGVIAEIYPARIDNVYSIELLDSKKN